MNMPSGQQPESTPQRSAGTGLESEEEIWIWRLHSREQSWE